MIEWLLVHMFLHLVRRSFQEGINSFRKEFALLRANSFLKELIPIEKRGKNENGRVVCPFHHKVNSKNESINITKLSSL